MGGGALACGTLGDMQRVPQVLPPCIVEVTKCVHPGGATDFKQEIPCWHELSGDEALLLCLFGFVPPPRQVETWSGPRDIAALGLVSRYRDGLMASPDNSGPVAGDISLGLLDASMLGAQMFRHLLPVVLSHRSVVQSWLNAMLSEVSQTDITCAISGACLETDEHNAREPRSPKRNILLATYDLDKVSAPGCVAVAAIRIEVYALVKTKGLQSGHFQTMKFENALFESADEAPTKTTIGPCSEGLEGMLVPPHERHRSSIPERRLASRRTWRSYDAGLHVGPDCRTNVCGCSPARPSGHALRMGACMHTFWTCTCRYVRR